MMGGLGSLKVNRALGGVSRDTTGAAGTEVAATSSAPAPAHDRQAWAILGSGPDASAPGARRSSMIS